MSKFETNGKIDAQRDNLIRRIEALESQQRTALAAKANGKQEPVDIQKKLDRLREELRNL